jgi:nucleoside-diphosphate-sugar epimerase
MRVIVLGGTRFIGRASVEELVRAGHTVMVVHRGETEPDDLVPVQHVHVPRADLVSAREELKRFEPDVALDCVALSRADADHALAALPDGVRLVVMSSIDVYQAYSALMAGQHTEPVPLDEGSAVRTKRYPYRGQRPGLDDYEKLDVEDAYRARGGVALRLPMVYGAHDRQRREEFILRRVRAGRQKIPFGSGGWLACRGYVGEMARGVRLALETPGIDGEVFNFAERRTAPIRVWAEQILAAAQSDAELVRVDDSALPEDLKLTGAMSQHLLTDSAKARTMLGWEHVDPLEGIKASVLWHLEHAPTEPDSGFEADDRALAQAVQLGDRVQQ